MLIDKTHALFSNQPYLDALYTALFSTAYFGMFRVGELTSGEHPVLVNDVQIDRNKQKILFILRTSKTHGYHAKPQLVKIQSYSMKSDTNHQNKNSCNCPYSILRTYISMRPRFHHKNEPFFIFRDFSPVRPYHMRKVLKITLRKCGFEENCYDTHSLRTGRTEDLVNVQQVPIDVVKKLGRWKSNCIYRYLL